MSTQNTGSNVFAWISHVAQKGANIVIAGEHGSGKSHMIDIVLRDIIKAFPQDKTFLSLKKFPVLETKETNSVAVVPVSNVDMPVQALRMRQDRLIMDEVADGRTLENIFLFHDITSCEGSLGQYIFTLDTPGSIQDKINDLAPVMSDDDVRRELLETIDFVIYMNPAKDRAEGYPEGIKSVSEVIVDAAGNVGERTIWEYSDIDESVFLQTGTPSRHRREKFFWC